MKSWTWLSDFHFHWANWQAVVCTWPGLHMGQGAELVGHTWQAHNRERAWKVLSALPHPVLPLFSLSSLLSLQPSSSSEKFLKKKKKKNLTFPSQSYFIQDQGLPCFPWLCKHVQISVDNKIKLWLPLGLESLNRGKFHDGLQDWQPGCRHLGPCSKCGHSEDAYKNPSLLEISIPLLWFQLPPLQSGTWPLSIVGECRPHTPAAFWALVDQMSWHWLTH